MIIKLTNYLFKDLEDNLKKASQAKFKLIVTDGVFSMVFLAKNFF